MPIYQTAHYQVKPEAVDKVKTAIVEFIDYVSRNEPGSQMYAAWQQKDDPTKFVHLFKFADPAAHEAPLLCLRTVRTSQPHRDRR